MTKPGLPESQRRQAISVTLSPAVIAMLDTWIKQELAQTRSAAVELAIVTADQIRAANKRRGKR